jgi:hypothetical protein
LLFTHILPSQAAFAQSSAIRPSLRIVGVDERGQEVRLDTLFIGTSRTTHYYTFPRRFAAGYDLSAARGLYCVPPTPNIPLERFTFTPVGINAAFVNTLGQRLRQNPQTTLTLQHSPQDQAKQNAALIKAHLESVWSIAPARVLLRASARKESARMDTIITLEGAPILFEPTAFADTVHRTTPPVLRFYLTTATVGIPQQWGLSIKQRKKNVRVPITAAGRLRPVVDWKVAKEQNAIQQLVSDSMLCDLEIRYTGDIPNERSLVKGFFVKVHQAQANARIPETYTCTVIFAEGSSTLTPEARAAVRRLKESVVFEKGNVVHCTSAEATDADAQKALHKKRVKEVAQQLGIPEDRILPVLRSVPTHGDMEIVVP